MVSGIGSRRWVDAACQISYDGEYLRPYTERNSIWDVPHVIAKDITYGHISVERGLYQIASDTFCCL